MVILLVVLVFSAIVVIDLMIERRREVDVRAEGESRHHALEKTEPKWIAGFKLPAALNYHWGHAWAHWVSPQIAYVGIDDFARRLIGSNIKISTRPVGTQVSQGEGILGVRRNGHQADLLSPVTGEIVAVNPELKENPGLVFGDNYGRGWIYKIKSPELFRELPNLLSSSLAERWIEDTRDRFQHQLMLATGSVIQDGGASIEDIGANLETEEWTALVGEFLGRRSIEISGEVR